MNCTTCGAPNPPGAAACGFCGAALAAAPASRPPPIPSSSRRQADVDADFDDDSEFGSRRFLAPHRGGAVLTLGIVGFVCCVGVVTAVIACVMGTTDLREMREGRMDRSGEGMTTAGRICAIISLSLHGVWLLISVFGSGHPNRYMPS